MTDENAPLESHQAGPGEAPSHGYHDWQETEFTLIATTWRQLDACSVCGVLRLRPVSLPEEPPTP